MIKDPTVPPPAWLAALAKPDAAQAVSVEEASKVQLIVVGKTRKFALVDGRVVQAGDVLGGGKITAIRSSKVMLEDDSKNLSVTPNVEKKAPVRPAAKKNTVVVQGDNVSPKQ